MEPINYIPHTVIKPGRCLSGTYGTSSWIGLESILADLLDRFQVGRKIALEFGVEHGYSLVALSNFFESVIGVDPFGQMTSSDPIQPMIERCKWNISQYDNIQLVNLPWQEFTKAQPEDVRYDLIHVDGEHGYYDTFGCGDWACGHSPCVIFHDTMSFMQTVMPALCDLSEKHGRKFYNFEQFNGLGVLV